MFKKLQFGRFLSFNPATLSLLLYFLIGGQSARAIPEEQAWDKLSVIPVFFIANKENNAFSAVQPQTQNQKAHREMSGYLDMNMAGSELERLKTVFGPAQVLNLRVMNLDTLISVMKENNKAREVKGELPTRLDLIGPLGDRELAIKYLKQDGIPNSSLSSSLRIPVFFSEPPITLKEPGGGSKQLLFLIHGDLVDAINRLPYGKRDKVKIKAVDLYDAIKLIIDQDEDIFSFYPTPAYKSIRDKLIKSGGANE